MNDKALLAKYKGDGEFDMLLDLCGSMLCGEETVSTYRLVQKLVEFEQRLQALEGKGGSN